MEHVDRFEASPTEDGRYRLLVGAATDYAIYMLSPEGIVTSWNPGARRFKGYEASEIVGEHFSKFYTEEDRAAGLPRRALEIAARDGKFETDGWRTRKDGTTFWANAVIDAIRDDHGELIGFAKIARDITERRTAQRELETAREALFQSRKMDAIGQLTGGVAHDFNNLLMAVLGSLDLVKRRLPEDPKITPLLDNAMKAAKRGAALTQRMLAFARRQDLKPEPVDAVTLVRGMAELLEHSLGPSIVIETRFPISLDRVHVDATQLETALLNLAVNARDAMPDGGTIVIAAREQTVGKGHANGLAPGRYVCLSVQDHGEGMDTATLARAAEPFFTTKGIGKGTGLGLSMVHGLAEQSGGRLLLNSQKGKGTTAEMWLPAVRANKDADAGQPDMAAAIGPQPAGRLTIVAVDDDSLVLMNTVAMLEDLGHQVLQAASGKEALEIFQTHDRIDLLVVDQAMPRMTGTQLIEKIRAARPGLPIILATGYAELPADAPENLLRLSKPFSQIELAKLVSDAIAQEPPKPEPAIGKVLKFRQS